MGILLLCSITHKGVDFMAQIDSCTSSVDSTKSQYIVYNTQAYKKTDKESNQELLGSHFSYSSIYDNISYSVRTQYENGFYRISQQSKNVSVDDASLWLPTNIKNVFDSIVTYDDYLDYTDITSFGGRYYHQHCFRIFIHIYLSTHLCSA